MKYLKYFLPSFTAIVFLLTIFRGEYYPTAFFIIFSSFIIIGDHFLPKEKEIQNFYYPGILNMAMYINLPILLVLIFFIVILLSSSNNLWFISILNSYNFIDLNAIKNSFNFVDKLSLIVQTALFVGILGIVPGHELTHRVGKKMDMFIGNWLLSFSWDCTFAIEHVHGHHSNVCYPEDPASAKRGQNIYAFIANAIIQAHLDAWKIEKKRLNNRGFSNFNFKNRIIIGYLRSSIITIFAFLIGGIWGMLVFLTVALVAKSFLETINYVEHYGLVREKGQKVQIRHSWNTNHILSSIYLFNVTRHSDHHRQASLKFWELHPCPEKAPMTPYGYLTMLYLVLLAPMIYRKIMDKKLVEWDLNFANAAEKKLTSF